ncbi:MAG: zf-HC2 domain-containing protein [Mobilitalea sp.]
MKISCKVIEDLLPLYVEDCCSEETKQLVEEHLLECEICKLKQAKLSQPIFLSKDLDADEKLYAKHAKKAFGKLQRRLIAPMLILIMLLVPITWLGVNEAKGDGISFSSLKYAVKGYALLHELKSGDYEKAFTYLDLKALYDWETEYEEPNLDSKYRQVTIGGAAFYIDMETFNSDYQQYLAYNDEAFFWKSIYLKNEYMIPASKAELYLKESEEVNWQDFMEYKVNNALYYINGRYRDFDVENVGSSLFNIMPEDYYVQVKQQIEAENKVTKSIIQRLLDMGYEGYVAEYQQQWIENLEKLEKQGITIVGYKLTMLDHGDTKYQLDYKLKLNDNGDINNDYGLTFFANKNGFYPSGGSISGASMESKEIPIINALHHTLNNN